jgi:hypothetical protein
VATPIVLVNQLKHNQQMKTEVSQGSFFSGIIKIADDVPTTFIQQSK